MFMVQKFWILRVFLCVIWALPAPAQELPKLNFNVGGGVSTPLNPTGQFAGVSGNFVSGVGYNIDKKSAIIGEFMWSGLPPNIFFLHPINAPFGNINLYHLGANYRYQNDRISGSRFGAYAIAGGGWYYRRSTVDKTFIVPPLTPCLPIYTWWGYGCDSSGYVYTATVAFRGNSAGGLNAGAGFTIRLADSSWKFYMEGRYHYAWHSRVPTTLAPVTFGIRYN
jgi:hypothetical protein